MRRSTRIYGSITNLVIEKKPAMALAALAAAPMLMSDHRQRRGREGLEGGFADGDAGLFGTAARGREACPHSLKGL